MIQRILAIRPTDAALPDVGGHRSRRRLVLLAAAFTVVVEVLSIAGVLPPVKIGGLPLSLSLIPALGLGVACGDRLLGRSTLRRVAIGYWIVAGLALAGLAGLYIHYGHAALFIALAAAALGEELVYRLAIPAVVAVALIYAGVTPTRARIAGLALAGVWFVALPGHRDQMHSAAGAVPFIAFATLSAVLVYRSGSVLPMAASHAVVNMLTLLAWNDDLPTSARSMGFAAVLGLLVLAYGRPQRLTLDPERGMVDTSTGLKVEHVGAVARSASGPPSPDTAAGVTLHPVDDISVATARGVTQLGQP